MDYAKLATVVLVQIKKHGQQITLTRRTQGAYNPSTSSSPVTESNEIGYGIAGEYEVNQIGGGGLIKDDDIKFYVAAEGLTNILPGDFITLANGEKFKVVRAPKYSPAGITLLYECQLRK